MNTILAIAGVVIKELYRRKDFYVLFFLSALITLAAGSVNFFKDLVMVRYVKDICLLLIWLSTLIIAVITAARQIPAEKENRTIFPLLAKPVSRGQVIVGKFLGCWLATGLAVLVFYLFFILVTVTREHDWQLLTYAKSIGLQWLMLGMVIAMVLLGSVVFAAPSSNATICLVAIIGILFIGEHLNKIALRQSEPVRFITYSVYFVIPHFEIFDVRKQVVNNQVMPSLKACGLAALYAGAYVAVFLYGTWLVFRRQRLNT
jgi:ABC-type transport system involved in multi-copper enzyme maturation permease subunit